jgi:bacitracin transport system permease protein
MLRLMEAEIKKLHASKMWWLLAAGAVLPALITSLSFLEDRDISWLIFMHVALLIFNVQSLLIFSSFAAFLRAREYEENMLEVILCYPYPKRNFLFSKLVIMLLIIGITVILFGMCTLFSGSIFLKASLPPALFRHFIKILLFVSLMHFLLSTAAFFLAGLTHMAVSGVIYGIAGMCLCMMLYSTDFIQFLPVCIPFVLTDHILGMDVMKILPYCGVHWSILAVWSVLFLLADFKKQQDIYSKSW